MNIYWEVYNGAWIDSGVNRLAFSGNAANPFTLLPLQTFNVGTHLLSSANADVCGSGSNHLPNVKLTQAQKCIITPSGGAAGSEIFISDANLVGGGTGTNGDFRYSSVRVHTVSDTAVSIQNAKLYCFDGVNEKRPAGNLDIAVWVVGSNLTQWFTLNSDNTTGPAIVGMTFNNNDVGGANSGLALVDQISATDHYYPIAVSVSPESSGSKTFALGFYLEYF